MFDWNADVDPVWSDAYEDRLYDYVDTLVEALASLPDPVAAEEDPDCDK